MPIGRWGLLLEMLHRVATLCKYGQVVINCRGKHGANTLLGVLHTGTGPVGRVASS